MNAPTRTTRRITSTLVAALTAISGVALLEGGAASAEEPARLEILPEPGYTAVQGGSKITFSGQTAAASSLVRADIVILAPGEEPRQVYRRYELYDLTLTPTGTFGGYHYIAGLDKPANDGELFVEVTLDRVGKRSTLRSNSLPIDMARPFIKKTSLVAPDRVRVDFSEGVRLLEPSMERVTEWQVDGQHPLEITGTGDVRYLKVAKASSTLGFDQDDTPGVHYLAAAPIINWGGNVYIDRAGWPLDVRNRDTIAVDRIAPIAPTIQGISGRRVAGPNDVIGNDRTPTVTLSGLRAPTDERPGHVGQVYLEANDVAGLQPGGDTLVGEAAADENGIAAIELAELEADTLYELHAAARDQALCSPPDGTEQCPNVSAGAPAFYRLDTLAPKGLYALMTSLNTIEVYFSESLEQPDGTAADWTVPVGGPITKVEGLGNKRVLTAQGPLVADSLLSWTPRWTPYTDPAGNGVEAFTVSLRNALPPTAIITSPTATAFTNTPNHRSFIGGTYSDATRVQVYRVVNGENQPLPATEASVTLNADGTFQAEVALIPNTENRFRVRAYRDSGASTYEGPMSGAVSIVHDSIAPAFSLQAMGRQLRDGSIGFRGGEQGAHTELRWGTEQGPGAFDANFNPALRPIRIEFSEDGGATWKLLSPDDPNDGSFPWTVPALNTEGALFRVTATDPAGNSASATTNAFVIDSLAPYFTAKTLNATQVLVTFNEPVGRDAADANVLEWRIDGVLVSKADPGAGDGPTMDSLTLTTGWLNTGAPAQQQLSSNATPAVQYAPPGEALSVALKDRVDHVLTSRLVRAADGIFPGAPTVKGLPPLTGEKTAAISGTAPADAGNVVQVRRQDGLVFTAPVSATGTWSVQAPLQADSANSFEAYTLDVGGNASDSLKVATEHDGTNPVVKLGKVKQRRSRSRVVARIGWATQEVHKDAVRIEYKLVRGKRGKLRVGPAITLMQRTEDDGTHLWRIPKKLWGKRIIFTVRATDLVGNVGEEAMAAKLAKPRLRRR